MYLKDDETLVSDFLSTPSGSRDGVFGNRDFTLAMFGISPQGEADMVESQGGGCAICGKTEMENGRRLATDHCHKTGTFRGFLCMKCNIGLGYFADDTKKMQKAILYLKRHEKCHGSYMKAI